MIRSFKLSQALSYYLDQGYIIFGYIAPGLHGLHFPMHLYDMLVNTININ